MNNEAIRANAKQQGIKLWEIAYALGITDATFSRRLRLELPKDEQDKIFAIIQSISERKRSKTA